MTLSHSLREMQARPERRSAEFWCSGRAYRAGVIICVLLVFFTSLVAAAHFHANELEGTDHACPLCALAHTGVAVNSIDGPVPVFTPSVIAEVPAITPHPVLLISSYYIRPPPTA